MPKKSKKEKAREKLLKKKQQEHDKIEREITYGKRTYDLHEKKWKEMMMKIALPRLRQDLMYIWQSFERSVDCKDFTISLLMDELDCARKQHLLKISLHVADMDRIFGIFKDQSEDMALMFRKSINALRDDAKQCDDKMNSYSQQEETYLKIMLYGLEQMKKDNEKNIRGELVTKQNDEKNKAKEYLGQMSYLKELLFEHLFEDILRFSNQYYRKTEDRRVQYTKLFESDTATRAENSSRAQKMVRMHEMIRRLKVKFEHIQAAHREKMNTLKAERQFFLDNYNDLKVSMEETVRKFNKNLNNLVINSGNNFNVLKKLQEKGERILTQALICGKYLTRTEAISKTIKGEPDFYENMSWYASSGFLSTVEHSVGDNLAEFWEKIAKADMSRLMFLREGQKLMHENNLLKEQIFRYCQCLECVSFLPPIHTNKKVTVVDANDVIRNYSFGKAMRHLSVVPEL